MMITRALRWQHKPGTPQFEWQRRTQPTYLISMSGAPRTKKWQRMWAEYGAADSPAARLSRRWQRNKQGGWLCLVGCEGPFRVVLCHLPGVCPGSEQRAHRRLKLIHGVNNLYSTSIDMQEAPTSKEAHAILLFYAYIELDATDEHEWHGAIAQSLGLGGRIRIAPQGLNGTLSGTEASLREYCKAVAARHGQHASRIDWKFGAAEVQQLFPDLSCRVVAEVVSLGVSPVEAPLRLAGRHLTPAEFHEELHRATTTDAHDLVLLDARNVYESRIGRFAATNVPTLLPQTRQFSDLPAWIDAHVEELRGRRVLMYCTGGVRCETASAYLRRKLGLDQSDSSTEVLQLAGGIERYMAAFPEGGFWRGSNLVFDRRLRTAPEARSRDVIGSCQQCAAPADDYAPQRRCTHCRLLLLVCPACCAVYPCGSTALCCEPCAQARKQSPAPAQPPIDAATAGGSLPQHSNRR